MLRGIVVFSILMVLVSSAFAQVGNPIPSRRYELLSGVRKSKDPKKVWDERYGQDAYVYGKVPAKFLSTNFEYITRGSKILDVGMGEGRNAVFLARKGFTVTGIDISSVAIRKARQLATEFGVSINAVVASAEKYKIPKGSYDAIICFYYVDRALIPKMLSWLKPGGIMIYEAYTSMQKQVKGFENERDEYLLKPGELLELFSGHKVLKFEEPRHKGEYTSSIIVQKK